MSDMSPQRLGGVPTTPDPNACAKYHDATGGLIVMQMGGAHTIGTPHKPPNCGCL